MLKEKEVPLIIFCILLMTYIIAFADLTLENIIIAFLFSSLILIPHVLAHKIAAEHYIAKSEFRLLEWGRHGWSEEAQFKTPLPAWLIFPVIAAFITAGKWTLFTVETFKLTWKPRKRIGRFYTELQEWEIANIALAGPIVNLILAFVAGVFFSFFPIELIKQFAILNTWFALYCLIPIGGLDGTRVLFGGKIRWVSIFVFTAVMLILLYFLNIYLTFVIALIIAAIIGLWALKTEF